MSKPRIGLAALSAINRTNDTPVAAVNRVYVDAVVAAGGLPILLPVQVPADAVDAVASVDGVLLCGGVDIGPVEYGALAGSDIQEVDQERDGWELALAEAARAAGVPLLGVCRGAQILNVSAGGTLVRDISTVTGMNHRDGSGGGQVAHDVWMEPDSLVARVCERTSIGVNTLHHQAVERPGTGLRPVAWAPDATVEAIESVTEWQALGVQWHPELLVDHPREDVGRPHRALFSWLVSAAQARRMHVVHGEPAGGLLDERRLALADVEQRQAS
jgi:putative glutamine amidotransferase